MHLKQRLFFLLLASVICFGATTIIRGYLSGRSDIEEVTSKINDNIIAAINEAKQDLNTLTELYTSSQLTEVSERNFNHQYFGYTSSELKLWSNIEFVPEYRHIQGDYTLKFIRTVRNDYLALKNVVGQMELIVTIPIHHDYKIENKYFESRFNELLFPDQGIRLTNYKNAKHKVCYQDQCLFGIEYQDSFETKNDSLLILAFLFFLLGFIFILLFSFRIASVISYRNFLKGLGFLLLSTFLMRYLMLEASFPNDLLESELFDSRIFASSLMNASFADLFINLFILFAISLFIFSHLVKSAFYRKLLRLNGWKNKFVVVIFLGIFLLSFHWIFLLFQTIYHNSQVSFDINQSIELTIVRVAVFTAYLLFVTSIILLSHVGFRTARHLAKSTKEFVLVFIVTLFLFVVVNAVINQSFIASSIVAVLLISALLFSSLGRSLSRITYNSFLYLFLILISISVLGAWAIYDFENEREIDKKKKYGNQFLIDNDHMAEYLLSVINEKIKNDIFIQSRLASPFLSKDIVESKIRQVYLNNYFDKYDIEIFIYDAVQNPLVASAGKQSAMLRVDENKYATGYEGIYFINLQEVGATKRYLDYLEIKRRGLKVGYILIDMKLKRIIPDNVYPEMLVDNRYLSPYQNSNYSYAVFNDNEVTYSSGDFNYNDAFILESSYLLEEDFTFNGYKHVAINDQAGHRLVISSTDHPLSDVVSNFSFLFLLKIIVLLLMTGSYALYIWYRQSELSYTARIQLYLNGAFFLPLFAVSITTLSLINSSFEKEVISEYYKKAENVGNNLSNVLSDFNEGITNEDELKQTISEISKFSNTDINVFGTKGKLIATNQPAIYDNELLSEYVNPQAYAHIVNRGEKSFTTKESVGKLAFNSTYFGIKSFATGDLVGIVSIPFFDSEYALEQSQILVITNIISVFAFVFIFFLVISYFATDWLTFPLTFITQKLKKTSLTEFNEPLNWNANDEIGLMVGEYNRMLVNLEESKRALARSEKQSAWREIAQQVAHEIKNPLTPMKLTLQHLSRKLSNEKKDEELTRPIDSLLKQIDTLDDIASSFSSFAKMPIPESEKYEFTSVIIDTVNLYKANENAIIDLQLPDQKVYTVGDEQLMGRIISNLLLNAVQSSDKELTQLKINLELKPDRAVLNVTDDGDGIPEDIRQKIFIPNFTTKDTGSGIGLAIAKHGIEHAGGKIWFETEENKGTTFFIELLIAEE